MAGRDIFIAACAKASAHARTAVKKAAVAAAREVP
jgi:hypothetical protein